MLVKGRVTDMNGKPVSKCLIETWETVSGSEASILTAG